MLFGIAMDTVSFIHEIWAQNPAEIFSRHALLDKKSFTLLYKPPGFVARPSRPRLALDGGFAPARAAAKLDQRCNSSAPPGRRCIHRAVDLAETAPGRQPSLPSLHYCHQEILYYKRIIGHLTLLEKET